MGWTDAGVPTTEGEGTTPLKEKRKAKSKTILLSKTKFPDTSLGKNNANKVQLCQILHAN